MKRKRRTKEQMIEARRRRENPYPRSITFFYESDGTMYRWWNNQDPGDMFDIITREELDKRIEGAAMCRIPTVNHLPGFCDLGNSCPDHLGYH